MNRKLMQKIVGVGLTLFLIGCAPGETSVLGKLEKNGQPVANQEVTLAPVEDSEGEKREMQTDANGQFVFEDIVPGTYYLLVGIVTEGPIGCSTSSPGFSILALVTDKGTLSLATSSEEPFDVKDGQGKIVKDIVFSCK